MSQAKEIYGLSLWRPWPWAFVNGPDYQQKRVENRTWKPPAGVEWLALHAAKRWDDEGAAYIERATGLQVPPDAEHPSGQIFAVCRLTHVFELEWPSDVEGYPDCVSLWAFGPFCWVVDDVLPLVNPVPCPGAQWLWKLSGRPGLLEQVRAAYTESMKARKAA